MHFLSSLSMLELTYYASASALVMLSLWGVIHFFPHRGERADNGPAWLILAIWLGFLGNGLHSFVVTVVGAPLTFYEVLSEPTLDLIGLVVGGIVGKGLAAVSVYLHFFARWKSLAPVERPFWSPLIMGLYPDKTGLCYRTLRLMTFKWKDRPRES